MTPLRSFARLYDVYLRKPPRQSRSRAAVEAILVAAVEHLSRDEGSSAVALQRVADRAGVGVGSLYDYFRDRDSLWTAAAAKVTEDNRRAFERVLEATEATPLREAVSAIIDFALDTYLTPATLPRVVLRIAHSQGLMPMLAASQGAFAQSLAASLRRRTDVSPRDPDATAWVLTGSIMGVVNALVWTDALPVDRTSVRTALVDLCVDHLALR